MKFIPEYRVCYNGVFYEADAEFEIDPADAGEMREHGEIVEDSTPPPVEDKPKRRRPRRMSDGQP